MSILNYSEYSKLNEGKETSKTLPKTNLEIIGFGKDSNGNTIAKFLTFDGKTKINIQTNGNMSSTHSLAITKKISELSDKDLQEISTEIIDYIQSYGTAKQKEALVVR
jgi:hypothetical protein